MDTGFTLLRDFHIIKQIQTRPVRWRYKLCFRKKKKFCLRKIKFWDGGDRCIALRAWD